MSDRRTRGPYSTAARICALAVAVINLALVVPGFMLGNPWWQIGLRLFIAAVFAWIALDRRLHPRIPE